MPKVLYLPLPRRRLRQAVDSYREELVALRAEGLRFRAIGERMGISEQRARKVYAEWRRGQEAAGG